MMPSRKAPPCNIYVNGTKYPNLQLLSATRSCGGSRLDTATVSATNQKINRDFWVGFESKVQVAIEVFSNGAFETIHWGMIDVQSVRIGPSEGSMFTSRMEPYHFGDPLLGMLETTPGGILGALGVPNFGLPDVGELISLKNSEIIAAFTGGGRTGQRPGENDSRTKRLNVSRVVFNPEIDGIVEPNMTEIGVGDLGFGPNLWIDPESTRTEAARKLQGMNGDRARFWTLDQAVYTLCRVLNKNQTYVKYPTFDEIKGPMGFAAPRLRNDVLPVGIYLPEALDMLLGAYGYTWFVAHNGRNERKIQIVKRGEGPSKVVSLQVPGSQLQVPASNLVESRIDFNIGSCRNSVTVFGARRQIEATFELVPAWDPKNDKLDINKLAKSSEEYLNNADYQRVWRDWVLNEAGDYIGLRPATKNPFDFSKIFGHAAVPRRRRFLPTITKKAKNDDSPYGAVNGLHVEWSSDGGETWHQLDELVDATVHVLERECGIRFEGELPPIQMMFTEGTAFNTKVRVTATVEDDDRLQYTATDLPGSPQGVAAPMVLDCSDRFRYRRIHKSSVLIELDSVNDQVDDSDEIADYAKKLLAAWNMADISAVLAVEGLDYRQYLPGDVITKVEGREVDLDAKPRYFLTRYPQIVSMTYDYQNQRRILNCETFREAVQ